VKLSFTADTSVIKNRIGQLITVPFAVSGNLWNRFRFLSEISSFSRPATAQPFRASSNQFGFKNTPANLQAILLKTGRGWLYLLLSKVGNSGHLGPREKTLSILFISPYFVL
jgi:hypothetical protein